MSDSFPVSICGNPKPLLPPNFLFYYILSRCMDIDTVGFGGIETQVSFLWHCSIARSNSALLAWALVPLHWQRSICMACVLIPSLVRGYLSVVLKLLLKWINKTLTSLNQWADAYPYSVGSVNGAYPSTTVPDTAHYIQLQAIKNDSLHPLHRGILTVYPSTPHSHKENGSHEACQHTLQIPLYST